MAILRSIKLTTAVAAFAMFFLPWIDIQCSGKSLITQTGIQTITGMATASGEMEAKPDGGKQEPLGSATMVAAALLATGLAIACLVVALFNNNPKMDVGGSVLCALALLLLIVQVSQGFPAKEEIVSQISTDQASADGDMGASLAMAMMANIQVEVLPAFTMTCVLLGVPVLLLVGLLLMKLGAEQTKSEPVVEEEQT